MGTMRAVVASSLLVVALALCLQSHGVAGDATAVNVATCGAKASANVEQQQSKTCASAFKEGGASTDGNANATAAGGEAATHAERVPTEAGTTSEAEAAPESTTAGPESMAAGAGRIIQLSASNPRAYLFKNFLTDEECDHIVGIATPELKRSQVVDGTDGHEGVSEVRTSSGMFIDKAHDAVIDAVERRISLWTFLPIPNQEAMQVLRYGIGQKYDAHHDYFDDPKHKQRGGHRYATVLMYLNNVTMGGETTFPQHKDATPKDDTWSDCAKGVLAVKPSKGDALLFFNMLPDGNPDESSLHHACPVVEGEKWSAPKWIHVSSFDEPVDKAEGPAPGQCVDINGYCEAWAELGECEKNREYMIGSDRQPGACRKSCKACTTAVE